MNRVPFGYFKILSLLACVFLLEPLQAQTIDEIKAQTDIYIWGEGVGINTSAANQDALAMLVGNITTNVEAIFESRVEQETKNTSSIEVKQEIKSLVKTYSNATLKNTEFFTWGKEPEVHVFRFMKKAEVKKIFSDREKKIKEFTRMADKYEASGQVADALRYYYWALGLLHSHPDTDMSMKTAEGEQKLDVYLPDRINAIFNQLKVDIVDKEGNDFLTTYLLDINYKGRPATNCDYSFYDGRSWSNVIAAKDGTGDAEMMGDTTWHKELKLRVEYIFKNEWTIDKEVFEVLGKAEDVVFKKSYITIDIKPQTGKALLPQKMNIGDTIMAHLISADIAKKEMYQTAESDNIKYTGMLERVEDAIANKKYESVRDCFTPDGFDMFIRVVKYGNAVILTKKSYTYIGFEDGVLARSLSLRFNFNNNKRSFVEDLVFNISQKEGKIRSLSFGITKDACTAIIKNPAWSEHSRLTIVNFLENYQTAFALKRLDYIDSLFSDNALIITGTILKKNDHVENKFLNHPVVKFTQQTKSEYLTNLTKVFRSNQYINLQFTDIMVEKALTGGEIYGIQLKQDYFSSSYGDTGYLFLMVDLNVAEEPTIHVRTWQPEKDEKMGIYDIHCFKL